MKRGKSVQTIDRRTVTRGMFERLAGSSWARHGAARHHV